MQQNQFVALKSNKKSRKQKPLPSESEFGYRTFKVSGCDEKQSLVNTVFRRN